MFKFKKLAFLASLFMVGMLLLAACGAEEPTPAPVEEAIDTQATVEAVEAAAAAETEEATQATLEAAETTAAAETEEEMVEESDVVTPTKPSSESQGPTNSSEVPRISVEELKERLDNGEAIVIVDSRSEYEYDVKHIPGAISVPSVFAESPLDELPLDHEIVLYCTWPAEATSAGAAVILYKNGYTNVSALLGGMDEWEAAGYPVEES